MTTVSPSLLACDFLNIEKELKSFDEFENFWFHLDIMDGHFVPNLTFGHPIVKKISKKTNQKLDAHFMVTNPEFYLETFKDLGIHNFTFHLEACNKPLELLKEGKKHYQSMGISIKPKTLVSDLSDEVLQNIDLLLVMSVEPGFGGQSFIEETYERLDEIMKRKKQLGLDFEIQIDGGVSDQNSNKLISHGATNLVAGSYVFKNGPSEYKSKVDSLRGE